MPRDERTFTSGDIVRFWCKNLDDNERLWVLVFFWTVVPGIILTDTQIERIFDFIGTFVGGKLSKIALNGIFFFLKPLRLWLNTTWVKLVFANPDLRKEVLACIEEALSKPQ